MQLFRTQTNKRYFQARTLYHQHCLEVQVFSDQNQGDFQYVFKITYRPCTYWVDSGQIAFSVSHFHLVRHQLKVSLDKASFFPASGHTSLQSPSHGLPRFLNIGITHILILSPFLFVFFSIGIYFGGFKCSLYASNSHIFLSDLGFVLSRTPAYPSTSSKCVHQMSHRYLKVEFQTLSCMFSPRPLFSVSTDDRAILQEMETILPPALLIHYPAVLIPPKRNAHLTRSKSPLTTVLISGESRHLVISLSGIVPCFKQKTFHYSSIFPK